ncbi:MAG: hypothetical protein QNJ44_22610 [Rhodobacter sp.]|nr:hypothetical protein [Rhodobacter sp.]
MGNTAMDHDDHTPMFCEVNGTYCVRAFCEDYGCADALGVPVTQHDRDAGCNRDAPAVLGQRQRRRKTATQPKLL